MISTDRPNFLDCLHEEGTVFVDNGIYTVSYPSAVNPNYYEYTDAELAEADYRFPKVVAKLCRQYKHSSVPLTAIINTMAFWKTPLFLKGTDGEPYAIKSVMRVNSVDRDAGIIELSIQSYHHFKAGSYVYVTRPEDATITVAVEELEKRHPGWLVRYDVLGALENDNDELLKTLFQSLPKVRKSTKIAMSGISFD